MNTTKENQMETKLSPESALNSDLYFANFVSTNVFPLQIHVFYQ
jgi:hypothetical protein